MYAHAVHSKSIAKIGDQNVAYVKIVETDEMQIINSLCSFFSVAVRLDIVVSWFEVLADESFEMTIKIKLCYYIWENNTLNVKWLNSCINLFKLY